MPAKGGDQSQIIQQRGTQLFEQFLSFPIGSVDRLQGLFQNGVEGLVPGVDQQRLEGNLEAGQGLYDRTGETLGDLEAFRLTPFDQVSAKTMKTIQAGLQG